MVFRLLHLQAVTAHRRDPPEPALSVDLLQHIFSFLPLQISRLALAALHEYAEAFTIKLLSDTVLVAANRGLTGQMPAQGAEWSAEEHGGSPGMLWGSDVELVYKVSGRAELFGAVAPEEAPASPGTCACCGLLP